MHKSEHFKSEYFMLLNALYSCIATISDFRGSIRDIRSRAYNMISNKKNRLRVKCSCHQATNTDI